MYWIGIRPGDVHLNISSPGWAKHAWSNVYAPWNAEATVLVINQQRFDARALLDEMARREVSTFCAPPTVWRMLIQEDLSTWQTPVREAVAAGEPLNPEVIDQVRRAWRITVRDGYGQTETTAQIGNPPGQQVVDGSMGRPLPGYRIALVGPVSGQEGDEGEICLPLAERPLALMTGYQHADELAADAMRGGYYHTGDVAQRDAAGYITYVGRVDDVFKASDYASRRSSLRACCSATRRRRSRRRAGTRSAPARRAEGVRDPCRRAQADRRDRVVDPATRARGTRALQARPPARVLGSPEDDLGKDPAWRATGAGDRT